MEGASPTPGHPPGGPRSWRAACQHDLLLSSRSAVSDSCHPLSSTISKSLLKLMSVQSVMPSNRLVLCHPLLLLSSTFPSTGVFSKESALCFRWPK